MGFASLGSGSKGNGTVVSFADDDRGSTTFLVDCGFTLKQTEQRLARLGLACGDLDGIFVSHEHADHISGVSAVAHRYGVKVYASYGTATRLEIDCHRFDGDVPFQVSGVDVNPVRVPHDAREPTQFVFSKGDETIGVLSDLGSVTRHVLQQFKTCTHILLESNHDRTMLANGSYPERLKQRVGADYGHLSNEQALHLLEQIAHEELDVVIGHVSEQNNRLDILEQLFQPMRASVRSLNIASQGTGIDWVGYRPTARQRSFSEVS